jgi:hypothetical protein
MMASADVNPFMKAPIEHSCRRASAHSSASLPGVAPCCAMPDCASCYSSLWSVHQLVGADTVVCCSVADALPLLFYLDGCFATIVLGWMLLLPMSRWSPLLADALLLWV